MSFINGIFLFATAAAAVPVLLHLVRRMKAKTMPFPSLMFLKATPRELVRRRRLKDVLLMAARAAMLLLLALAFARPFIPEEKLPFVPQREAESVVILVDRSFSMRYAGALERAVEAARQRVDRAHPDDEIAVVAFAEEADVLTPLSVDRAVIRGALNAVEPTYASTDYLPALQRGADVLAEARHRRRVVVLASDFQETGWARAPSDWKLPAGAIFEPLSVGSPEADNAHVEAFRHAGRRVEGRNAVRVDARIAAFGAAAGRRQTATLIIDGAVVDRSDLPARASAPLSFEHFAPREGYFQGALVLDEDALPDDNRFYFTHRADAPPAVLVVDGPSAAGRRDAFFLRTAFDFGEASRFRFTRANAATAGALQRSDVAFISDPNASGEVLRQFVENGGTLVLTPNGGDDARGFSRQLEALDAGSVDAFVDPRTEQGYEAIIGEVDLRHPIFAPFSRSGTLLRPRFLRYARIDPAEGSNVLGKFDTGDPFLVERRVGSGRLLVYASTLNTDWTDLPLDEVYVPFVYQLAQYGSERAQDDLIYTVGEAVSLRGVPGERWEVRTPSGNLFRITLDDQGRGYFRETQLPGHYTAAAGQTTRSFSVNVDPEESNLHPRDGEEVYAAVTSSAPGAPRATERASTLADEERNQKLWRILILLVIVLFAVETWFANRDRKKTTQARMDLPKAA